MTIQPNDDDPAWYASVSLLDDGTYEVELRDTGTHEHELTTHTDRNRIAQNLTIWLASRYHPQPTSPNRGSPLMEKSGTAVCR